MTALPPGNELRFEVPYKDGPAKVRLLAEPGRFAEILGSEMAPGNFYDILPGTSSAVFTWHGCVIEVQKMEGDNVYISQSSTMQHYARLHSQLEVQRRAAKERSEKGEEPDGPRVLICGAPDSGKATIAKILVNYAARLDWQLTYVDIDPNDNTISVPGSIAAVPIDMPAPIDEGFSIFPPTVSFLGSVAVDEKNEDLYSHIVATLAERVDARQKANPLAQCGGIIVKAGSGLSTKQVNHAIKQFNINTVLVVGDDKSHAFLSSPSGREGWKGEVYLLPRSGGCVAKDRERKRASSFSTYFNGWPHMRLHPHRFEVPNFDKITVVKVGGSLSNKIQGLLPIGETSTLTATDVTQITPSRELEHSILALSQASDQDQAASSPVYGFAKVLSVNEEACSMVLLLPVPGVELISNLFIAGDLRWIESMD